MKIGILSDTHDQFERTENALQQLIKQGAQHIIHCGDLVSAEMVELLAQFPNTMFCFGNNDNEIELRNQAEISKVRCLGLGTLLKIADKQIGVTHGHHMPTIRNLLKKKPDYMLVGHAHQQRVEEKEGTTWVNPGALHRAKPRTCAILETQNGQVEFLRDFSV